MIHKQTQNITIRLVLIVCGVMDNGNCGLWELYSFSMVPSPKAKSMCVSRSGTGRWIPNIVCKLDNDKIWRKLKHLDPYDIHHTLGYHPNIASENKVKKKYRPSQEIQQCLPLILIHRPTKTHCFAYCITPSSPHQSLSHFSQGYFHWRTQWCLLTAYDLGMSWVSSASAKEHCQSADCTSLDNKYHNKYIGHPCRFILHNYRIEWANVHMYTEALCTSWLCLVQWNLL